jgi:hypothetical protein
MDLFLVAGLGVAGDTVVVSFLVAGSGVVSDIVVVLFVVDEASLLIVVLVVFAGNNFVLNTKVCEIEIYTLDRNKT